MPDKTSKELLRIKLLKKRDSIPPEVRRAKNRMVHERLLCLGEYRNASSILFFASFRTEVDTAALIQEALVSGKKVILPKVDLGQRRLLLYDVRSVDELQPGYLGIPEPSVITEERLRDIDSVDVVIIPGAGFDPAGNRIGYGGGYYDRLLAGLTKDIPLIAPAFEEQIVDTVPSEPYDIRVGIIVTDRRVIRPTSLS